MTELEELEGLIDLAEDVSEDLNDLRSKVSKLKMRTIVVISLVMLLGALSITLFNNKNIRVGQDFKFIIIVANGVVGMLTIFYLILVSNLLKDYRRHIYRESKILASLLDMIHSQKESVNYSISVIQRAIIEMRLNRISYSEIWQEDDSQIKKIIRRIQN